MHQHVHAKRCVLSLRGHKSTPTHAHYVIESPWNPDRMRRSYRVVILPHTYTYLHNQTVPSSASASAFVLNSQHLVFGSERVHIYTQNAILSLSLSVCWLSFFHVVCEYFGSFAKFSQTVRANSEQSKAEHCEACKREC